MTPIIVETSSSLLSNILPSDSKPKCTQIWPSPTHISGSYKLLRGVIQYNSISATGRPTTKISNSVMRIGHWHQFSLYETRVHSFYP